MGVLCFIALLSVAVTIVTMPIRNPKVYQAQTTNSLWKIKPSVVSSAPKKRNIGAKKNNDQQLYEINAIAQGRLYINSAPPNTNTNTFNKESRDKFQDYLRESTREQRISQITHFLDVNSVDFHFDYAWERPRIVTKVQVKEAERIMNYIVTDTRKEIEHLANLKQDDPERHWIFDKLTLYYDFMEEVAVILKDSNAHDSDYHSISIPILFV